jgi:hypothetical protein
MRDGEQRDTGEHDDRAGESLPRVRLSEQQPAGQPDEHDADLAGRRDDGDGRELQREQDEDVGERRERAGGFDEVPGRVGDRPGEDQPGDQQSGRPLRSRDEVDELFDAPE